MVPCVSLTPPPLLPVSLVSPQGLELFIPGQVDDPPPEESPPEEPPPDEPPPDEPTPESSHLVFVYRSLLSGSDELFHNHADYLASPTRGEPPSSKVADVVTTNSAFVMVAREGYNFPYELDHSALADALADTSRADASRADGSASPLASPRAVRAPGASKVESLDSAAAASSAQSPVVGDRIVGEVWRMGRCTLDDLEGHPDYYRRRPRARHRHRRGLGRDDA